VGDEHTTSDDAWRQKVNGDLHTKTTIIQLLDMRQERHSFEINQLKLRNEKEDHWTVKVQSWVLVAVTVIGAVFANLTTVEKIVKKLMPMQRPSPFERMIQRAREHPISLPDAP
jgi:hypothetical protein